MTVVPFVVEKKISVRNGRTINCKSSCQPLIRVPFMVGDVFAVSMYWKEWNFDLVKRMLPAGIIGAGL